ncbi:acyl-CoA synthetase [Sphingobium lactosutens]|uniref:acyl-CoA synthetase n=1 Tax=Sphingobium lactosutens TaxID=522773 RepID=UPI0015C0A685|nr:acyl-CoA synthetase [Sphingobium lactosutens]NWK96251.1 acyl-CoA synthetase [Sphingobium lactosutens]
MHPGMTARAEPEKAAIIMADTGEVVSYRQLECRSNQAAHLFRAAGLREGDAVALLLDNTPDFLGITWGAHRAGLYFVCISTRLAPSEIAYILNDSGARLLVASGGLGGLLAEIDGDAPVHRFTLGEERPGWRDWGKVIAAMPDSPIPDERAGIDMLYSSGTTGRPKGIKPPLPDDGDITLPTPLGTVCAKLGFDRDTIYLSPAPLYHAAPLRWCREVQALGGTVVIMEKFDPEVALSLIERYRITHSQWVPTHFVRLLKLPQEVRDRHDCSSLKLAVHAAAPCPVPVKQAMIDWWGPILLEYYSGTEGAGITMISSPEWLSHPGSVGRSMIGQARICDEDDNLLPPRTEGLVSFEGGPPFSYHNDPEKTASVINRHGWATLGDVGWMDEDGYLYLTDRKSFMIISGGVNIYPQEIENVLVLHPRIADAAVVSVPDPEMGEQVVAVLQPEDMADATEAFAQELVDWLRSRLSGVKIPRLIEFMPDLPRHPTGKLYKRILRDRYWAEDFDRSILMKVR